MDNEAIKTSLEAIGAAISAVKGLVGLASSSKSIEMKQQAVDALEKLTDAQRNYVELQQEYLTLIAENQDLRSKLKEKSEVVFHDGAYWRQYDVKVLHDEGNPDVSYEPDVQYHFETREDGPFCPSCWTDQKLHRAQISKVESGNVYYGYSRHTTSYYFRVPEALVRDVDLSSYRAAEAIHDSRPRGPHSWMA